MTKAQTPRITSYALQQKGAPVDKPLRIALASDLHNHPCKAALAALRRCKPDIVLVAGDLMECFRTDDIAAKLADLEAQSADAPHWKRAIYRAFVRADSLLDRRAHHEDDDTNANAFEFLRKSAEIAPTLYAIGNHEHFMDEDTRRRVAETGAVLLDNADLCLCIRGTQVLVGGLSSKRDERWLARFAALRVDGIKLLICHHPEYYCRLLADKDVGIIFSGHAHGGQWAFLGVPLFAPGQGFFPKHAGGVYDDRLIVSRGLSNTAHIPRFGNPTELVLVEVTGEEDRGARPNSIRNG